MFERITLRGSGGEILRGHLAAAVLSTWTIAKDSGGHWTLTATVARVDAFQSRKSGLLFAAPRAGGFWCWPVEGALVVNAQQLIARLGPPEQ